MTFSVTSLETLFRCGVRYDYRYLQKIKTAPTSALILGRGVDEAVSFDLQNVIDHQTLLNAHEVTDIARHAVEQIVLTDGIMLTEEEAVRGLNRVRADITQKAILMASLHHTYIAPRLQPTHVQRKFEIPVAGHIITGIIDVQEGRSVRDTKVRSKSPDADEAATSFQLTVYAMAVAQMDGVVPESVCLDFLIATQQPKIAKQESTRQRYHFVMVEERVKRAAEAVERGLFMPADIGDWHCSRIYCPYFDICKFV